MQVQRANWRVLSCLVAVAIVNQWARFLFVYMSTTPTADLDFEHSAFINMRMDLSLDSAQYGFLSGVRSPLRFRACRF